MTTKKDRRSHPLCGQMFEIYQDPITREDYEGPATIKEIFTISRMGYAQANVLFDGDVEEYFRIVYVGEFRS